MVGSSGASCFCGASISFEAGSIPTCVRLTRAELQAAATAGSEPGAIAGLVSSLDAERQPLSEDSGGKNQYDRAVVSWERAAPEDATKDAPMSEAEPRWVMETGLCGASTSPPAIARVSPLF